jgi:chloramphenicol 3-O phosphotransferase
MEFKPDGSIVIGPAFRQAEASWYEGLAAIVRAGTGVIVDDVFLEGGASQARLQAALQGLTVLWVGVRCDPAIAAAREVRRPDRMKGLARNQAGRVHEGVRYDIVVDTTDTSTAECAGLITATLRS